MSLETPSILNDVLGPVMRGPSSSHTAGSYHIGKIARQLLGEPPVSISCTFDPDGSYAATYQPLGVDLAFITGLMDWSLTDDRFFDALVIAKSRGIQVEFDVHPLQYATHPNSVRIEMTSRQGRSLILNAESVGGGAVIITRLNEWELAVTGKFYEMILEIDRRYEADVRKILDNIGDRLILADCRKQSQKRLFHVQSQTAFVPDFQRRLDDLKGLYALWSIAPLSFVACGEALFSNAEDMVREAEKQHCSLGELAWQYEARLLNVSEADVRQEMIRRFNVMKASVYQGFDEQQVRMMLLQPGAGKIFNADTNGHLAIGGIHSRAAARAMAAMHVSNSMGVVCAAPTGGSAGVLPGVVLSLVEEKQLRLESAAKLLFAAGAIGLIIVKRATFAAEICGCQVEIGAAGAMAAAAVVEFAGGSAGQAAEAAAIALQNSMGLVCDPVHGACEIPCHTRNAVAASNAFICADLILGGYHNPIPLDETIDAMFAVGQALPRELRCTALGGIAVAPSAQSLPRQR